MILVKQVVDDILRAVRGQDDAKLKTDVMRLLNMKYFDLCEKMSIKDLRKKITLDFSDADDDGLWLPSHLRGIDMVRDSDDEFEFFERDRADIEPDEYGYRFYRYKGSETCLKFLDDVVINEGSNSFTSDALDAYITAGGSVDDYYIRFAEELGYYEITSDSSPYGISPTYWGPSLSAGEARIRPEETDRMIIIDESEDLLQDREVDVYYWKAPQPLYRESDFILLPTYVPLELLVLRELPEAKAYRPVSQGEIDDAIAELKRLNPIFARMSNPRDKQNEIFDFSTDRNYFERRAQD